MKLRWRFGLVAALFLTVFSLYPQMKLWYLRGAEWQGNYAYNDIDEVAYASYVKALVDGRPRRSDPYTGNDDSPETPQPESLFSIQFAAPYTLAIPSRLLSIPVPWLMTIGGAAAAALTALAVFWFLFQLTGSNWYAMAGSIVTLAGGALFAGEGAASEIFFDGFSYPYFPGFRRYIPALAMPAFFALIGLIWKIFSDERDNKRADRRSPYELPVRAALAVVLFAYAVFSYFYIWTTAAAWLVSFAVLYTVIRFRDLRAKLLPLGILAAGCSATLMPYAYLLSRRSHLMDDVQLLVSTHAPDFARFPEYISAVVIVLLVIGTVSRIIRPRSTAALVVLALAVTVIAVFNQQVITGRSLQPIHYQVFIGNYVAGLALVSVIGLLICREGTDRSAWARSAFATVTLAAAAWGFVECHYTVRVLDDANVARDEQMPLARRLTELAESDPQPHRTVVFHTSITEADDLPTIAPQATLWSRHQHVFTTISTEENKERYYQYLYYQGVTGEHLARSIKHGDFVSMIALFGWGRHTDRLNSDFKPLTYGEIDAEARNYDAYVAGFDPHSSPKTIVTYLVVREDDSPDLSNFDRWYDRDEGEQLGPFRLYRVRLRTVESAQKRPPQRAVPIYRSKILLKLGGQEIVGCFSENAPAVYSIIYDLAHG